MGVFGGVAPDDGSVELVCVSDAGGGLTPDCEVSGVIVEVDTCDEGSVVGSSVVAQDGRVGISDGAGSTVVTCVGVGAFGCGVAAAVDTGTTIDDQELVDVAVAVSTSTADSPTADAAPPLGVNSVGVELPVSAAPRA